MHEGYSPKSKILFYPAYDGMCDATIPIRARAMITRKASTQAPSTVNVYSGCPSTFSDAGEVTLDIEELATDCEILCVYIFPKMAHGILQFPKLLPSFFSQNHFSYPSRFSACEIGGEATLKNIKKTLGC